MFVIRNNLFLCKNIIHPSSYRPKKDLTRLVPTHPAARDYNALETYPNPFVYPWWNRTA